MERQDTEYLLSTEDNPYNPWTQWEDWYNWDEQSGYFTCGLLDRIAKTSPDLDESDNFEEIQNAQQRILELNPTGNYILVKKPEETNE